MALCDTDGAQRILADPRGLFFAWWPFPVQGKGWAVFCNDFEESEVYRHYEFIVSF